MTTPSRERLDELLLLRAIEGLAAPEERELTQLLAAEADIDESGYERAAAAVCLAVLGTGGGLPPSLRARLERCADEVVARATKDR